MEMWHYARVSQFFLLKAHFGEKTVGPDSDTKSSERLSFALPHVLSLDSVLTQ